MDIPAHVDSFVTKDYHTEAANTAIDEQINPIDGATLALVDFEYLAAATAHIASFMYAGGAGLTGSRNTASVLALSGQKFITCTNAPKDPAGNAAAASDIIAFQLTDGTWEWDTVAALVGSVIECTNNITGVDAGAGGTAIAAGGKVLIFGVVGDGLSQKVSLTASVVTRLDGLSLVHPYPGEPWYLSITNITNAGFLYRLVCAHINKQAV
jgi:hypothetical protein